MLNDSIHGCFNYVLVVVQWTSEKCTKKCRPVVLLKKQMFFIYVLVKSKLQNHPPVILPSFDSFAVPERREFDHQFSKGWGIWTVASISCDMTRCSARTKLVDMLWKLAARYRNYTDL